MVAESSKQRALVGTLQLGWRTEQDIIQLHLQCLKRFFPKQFGNVILLPDFGNFLTEFESFL